MQGPWVWVAITVAEVLLVVILLLLVSWVRNMAARRRDRQAIRALVDETRRLKTERLAEIRAFLSNSFGLSGDALGYAVRAIYKAEAQLIQAFAMTYLHRDARSAARFRRPVTDGIAPYWELAAEMAGDAEVVEPEAGDAAEADAEEGMSSDELARLKGENDRLSEELKVTMDTMSRMLNEYSTVFAKDADIGNISVIDEGEPPQATQDGMAPADADAAPTDTSVEGGLDEDDVAADAVSPADSATGPDAGAAPVAEDAEPTASDDATAPGSAAAAPGDELRPAPAAEDQHEPAADPDAVLAEMSSAADDPDAILAAMAQPEASGEVAADDDRDASRFAADLDPEMKDLSVDEDGPEADAAGEPDGEAVQQQAERKRIIDAES